MQIAHGDGIAGFRDLAVHRPEGPGFGVKDELRRAQEEEVRIVVPAGVQAGKDPVEHPSLTRNRAAI